MLDPDTGFEPLPISICERNCRDREPEQLARHTGDAVKALTRIRVEKIQLLQRGEPRVFRVLGHGIRRSTDQSIITARAENMEPEIRKV